MLLDVVRDGVSWPWSTTSGISPHAMAARATGWCLGAVDGAGRLSVVCLRKVYVALLDEGPMDGVRWIAELFKGMSTCSMVRSLRASARSASPPTSPICRERTLPNQPAEASG